MKNLAIGIIGIFIAANLFVSCADKPSKDSNLSSETVQVNPDDKAKTEEAPKQTFVVVTSLSPTTDVKTFGENISEQAEQLQELWKRGIIENMYYNGNVKFKDTELGNVVFFIRATDETSARAILDGTNFMVNKIGKYEIHPVGNSWFGTNEKSGDMRIKKGKSFAAVWTLSTTIDKMDEKIKKEQFDTDIKLYNEGILENAYLNTNSNETAKTPAVYFVNATNEKEAKKLLNAMPLVKSGSGKYELYYVGIAAQGKFDANN